MRCRAIRRPRPVFEYPHANMYAAKMSHTVAFENPLSAHAVAWAGTGRTRPSTVATHTPSMPTAAPGIGSVMTPVMVARNNAKKCHAFSVNPSGVGTSSTAPPTTNGATALMRIDWRVRDGVAGAATSATTDWTFIRFPQSQPLDTRRSGQAQDTTVIRFPA